MNKQAYIAIGDITVNDSLISQLGKKIRLLCPVDKTVRCGEHFNKDAEPVLVHNLEVYQSHVYYAGGLKALVHNLCENDAARIIQRAWRNHRNREKGILIGYHGTTPENATSIIQRGIKDNSEHFFITTSYRNAQVYGDTVISVRTNNLDLVRENSIYRAINSSHVSELKINKHSFDSLSFTKALKNSPDLSLDYDQFNFKYNYMGLADTIAEFNASRQQNRSWRNYICCFKN